ncbi:MAG: chromosomal replication initiator protein DnaA [Eubacterium sp.]|jgi:chromosomal replication initiator protein
MDHIKEAEIWNKVKEDIKQNVTEAAFNNFFRPAAIVELTDEPKIAYISTDKEIITNILRNRYTHVMETSFLNVTGENYRVVVKNSYEYVQKPKQAENFNQSSSSFNLNIGFKKEKIFNPKYTFDNFVVGESNNLAAAACKAVAGTPSEVYNPLFLYGGSGLGKTHLMNAIGIYMLENYENMKILYVSAETFTNDFIKSLTENRSTEFKNKYRRADVLLIDDIQFLEGKEGTQEEFFHTFNTLYKENKQIILSSDRPPAKLTNLDERLRSRFSWNMTAGIQPPDYELRVAILRKKAENMNIEVDDDIQEIIEMISERIKDNIRELEGAFTRVISFSELMREKPDVAFAKRVLKDIMIGGYNITPEKIRSVVCKHYKIKISDLDSETRVANLTYPRHVAMYLCRTMTDLSLPKIGAIFGNKHYSTVKHAVEKIEDEIKSDKSKAEEIELLKDEINNSY